MAAKLEQPRPRTLHIPNVEFKERRLTWVWQAFDTGTAPMCRIGKARIKLSPRDRRFRGCLDRPPGSWRRCEVADAC